MKSKINQMELKEGVDLKEKHFQPTSEEPIAKLLKDDSETITALQLGREEVGRSIIQDRNKNLFDKLQEDLGAKTTLEKILIERITMSYHWVYLAEVHLASQVSLEKNCDRETYEGWWGLLGGQTLSYCVVLKP